MLQVYTNELNKMMHQLLNSYFNSVDKIAEIQNEVLMKIIKNNSKTVYGKKYDFENIKNREDFEKKVPLNNYSDLKPFIEENKYKNNVILKDSVTYWAMTSGTSGTHKYIPHTKESLDLWDKGVLRAIASFISNNPKENLKLMRDNYAISIVGPALVKNINSVPVGYISGIVPSQNHMIKEANLTNDSINKIKNYKEKMQKIFELSLDNSVSFFAGITTFTINFINYVHEHGYEMAKDNPKYLEKIKPCLNNDGTVNISKLWPKLKFCLSTGTNIDLCKSRLLNMLPDLWISNLYSGTEGAYAFSTKPATDKLYLNYDFYYYEFKNTQTGKVYNLNQVKKNTPYEMIITCPNGLYRYTNGDLIEFTSLKPPIIRVLGRSNLMINIGGEKFNDNEINDCVLKVAKQFKLDVSGYCFSGCIGSDSCAHHLIAMEVENTGLNIEEISLSFFEKFKETKAYYKRNAGQLFKTPHVVLLKKGTFSKIQKNISNKKGIVGHSKIKHIYKFSEFTKLIHRGYINKHNLPSNIVNQFTSNKNKFIFKEKIKSQLQNLPESV